MQRAQELVAASLREWERDSSQELCPVPDEPLPPVGALGFRVQRYGMARWGDLFTARQKAALTGLVDLLLGTECSDQERLLACSFSRVAMSNMSCTRWNAVAEKMQHTFGRQALPIVWDFAEVVVTAPGPGNWESAYRLPSDVVDAACTPEPGQVQAADATNHPLPDETAGVWFTDPPYYDAIPCSDLSDFFLVCRPRPADALVGDWAEVLRELPVRVGDWMERLQGEGIRGADLVFACIGPALEIFSRYSRVEMADGSEVGLPAYLEKVWEVVGRTALENVLGAAEAKARNGLAGALEEDARLTTWTSPASGPTPGDSTGIRRDRSARFTDAWVPRSCSSRPAARSTRRPTCRNSGSRSASRTWTRRRSTQRPWISSGAATSFAGWEAASAFTTSRRSARS